MSLILALIFISLSIFFFILYFISYFKNKKSIKNDKNKKVKISFKDLSIKRKRIIFALGLFFLSALILNNMIFAMIISGLYIYFDWHIKDKERRKTAALIDKQVIEALTIIKNALQSGQSLPNAIDIAHSELKEPIKYEFAKMSENIALGISFDKVLNMASENSLSKEFRLMIDTIKISKDSGAALTSIFDRIIDSTMQRVAIQSKVNALTAQGRMSGIIVSLIPFIVILMMYMIDPNMMSSLFNTLAGNVLLLIVVVMVLTGSYIIRKLTEIDF